MIVLLAGHLPDALRGRLKLWFVEPRPNVFVAGLNGDLADRVITWLLANCPAESGLMALKKIGRPPGYEIFTHGEPVTPLLELSGLFLPASRSGGKGKTD